ncbi:DUF805 domain-containing protein [Acinetobacter bereziniae]|uniref:DUF805 domain-containing protein n=1 Tax=Acinetobacter bereziniae TaxID=106648 RepID=UPI0029550B57|nr:DUF805 domain-containing protein [Acinetobacter bereziniae]MDV8157869.1 DUF805 domain-containing protein [Acinetobacter bereziniae]
MKGIILDFSVQTNSGIISAENTNRYHFTGSEWKESTSPQRGQKVDFDIDEKGQAIAIYFELKTTFIPARQNIEQIAQDESTYNMFDWFMKCIKNYAKFDSRARRKEYWFFRLSMFVLIIASMLIDMLLNTEVLFTGMVVLATLIPDIAVSVRRLHGINKSGWWFLISCIPLIGIVLLIIWFTKEGDKHSNIYGDPVK